MIHTVRKSRYGFAKTDHCIEFAWYIALMTHGAKGPAHAWDCGPDVLTNSLRSGCHHGQVSILVLVPIQKSSWNGSLLEKKNTTLPCLQSNHGTIRCTIQAFLNRRYNSTHILDVLPSLQRFARRSVQRYQRSMDTPHPPASYASCPNLIITVNNQL